MSAMARSVVVTGAGSGIGRASAAAFTEHGDRVLAVGRTEADLRVLAKSHPGIVPLCADITDPGAPELIVSTAVREFGRLDVLVNNAASAGFGELADVTREHVTEQLTTNVAAPILLIREVIGPLSRSEGTVVNISSSGSLGRRAWPGNAVYGAGKTALDFLTRTAAVELAPRGIRVVGVAPGVVRTGIGARLGMSEQEYEGFLEHMAGRVPSGRVGGPEDIAWWIVRLTEPGAGYVTGSVLAIDGGLSLT